MSVKNNQEQGECKEYIVLKKVIDNIVLGVNKRRPQEEGEGVKKKRTHADMVGGGQAKGDVHI